MRACLKGAGAQAEGLSSAVRWGLTEKRLYLCLELLTAEGAAECYASPGLCFENDCVYTSDRAACVCVNQGWLSICVMFST